MAKIPVIVYADLRFPADSIEPAHADILRQALTVVDPDAEPGESVPIVLLRKDSADNLVVPRGFAHHLAKGLNGFGYEVEWDDRRVQVPITPIPLAPGFELRPHQHRPAERMWTTQQGIYEGPTASGKTMTSAAFISRAAMRTVILVDKINLADQWAERIHTATGGYECGIIGDGQWDERDITIALRQTLWSRIDDLDRSGWWATWGISMYDECHAISAVTVRELMSRFPSFWRIGLSATPDRHDWLTVVSRAILGEIFCRTTEEELEAAGYLVRPKVVAARTPFVFHWNRRSDHRREWQRLVAELRIDTLRNRFIASKVATMRGKAVLVDTDQVTHANELMAHILATGWPADRVHMFTGQQNREERRQIVELMDEGDRVVISTIGKEALDIPRLDRFLMTWPTRNDTRVKQMIGRVRRLHDEKSSPEIWDFVDPHVRILADQFSDRRGTYARANMELELI